MELSKSSFRGSPTAAHTLEEDMGFRPLPRRQVVITLGGVLLAMFLASLDQTVVGTAMPRIIADLGGFSRYTWVTTAYLVAATTVVPIVGRLSDIYGRKWFFAGGIAVFLFGSALAGLSRSMDQLIAFRAFQGLGAGVMMANAFVAIGDLFPAKERGKYSGFVSATFGLSAVIGPTLGGVVTDSLSWHWVFFINLPLGIPVIALFIRFFPHTGSAGSQHRLDYLGMGTLVLAVVPLMLALSWGGVQYEWSSLPVAGALAFSAVMVALFIATEVRSDEPVLPLELFRNPVVGISMAAIFATGFGMLGAIMFVPLFFQGVLGASATSSGSFLTPMMLGTVAGSALSGQALSRLGGHYRTQGLMGLGIMSLGLFLLSGVSPDTTYGHAVLSIVIVGFGLGMTMPVFTIAVQNAVPYRIMGIATSSTQFVRSIGGSVGLALLGAFMVSQFASGVAADVPAAVRQALPPERLDQLSHEPRILMSPDSQDELQSAFNQLGPQGADLGRQLLQALRTALASAIGKVFTVSLLAGALAFLVTLFLKEIPLKERRGRGSAPGRLEGTP
ncbi:MAG: MFS transporter [Chloroflexi bacterium]|nr:MFS transporter [Chloroflexota bacterium]